MAVVNRLLHHLRIYSGNPSENGKQLLHMLRIELKPMTSPWPYINLLGNWFKFVITPENLIFSIKLPELVVIVRKHLYPSGGIFHQ